MIPLTASLKRPGLRKPKTNGRVRPVKEIQVGRKNLLILASDPCFLLGSGSILIDMENNAEVEQRNRIEELLTRAIKNRQYRPEFLAELMKWKTTVYIWNDQPTEPRPDSNRTVMMSIKYLQVKGRQCAPIFTSLEYLHSYTGVTGDGQPIPEKFSSPEELKSYIFSIQDYQPVRTSFLFNRFKDEWFVINPGSAMQTVLRPSEIVLALLEAQDQDDCNPPPLKVA